VHLFAKELTFIFSTAAYHVFSNILIQFEVYVIKMERHCNMQMTPPSQPGF
jgi:hypothetical protein